MQRHFRKIVGKSPRRGWEYQRLRAIIPLAISNIGITQINRTGAIGHNLIKDAPKELVKAPWMEDE
jgi:hypothetical protein